jgi:hypothetical protein
VILTFQAGVVRLDVGLLYDAILGHQGIPLGAVAAKDGSAVEGKIQGLGKLEVWIGQKADLASR